jgi:SAM-dependent methyltransferase
VTTSAEPWYVSAFRSDYLRVYAHRDLDAARREVAGLVELGLAGRVLDLACGWGRHTLAMRERGLDVAGLDLSADLLANAPAELAGRLFRADARRVPFADAAFDGLTNLFSSFGYFGDVGDRAVLAEIARVVRPGGLALLDLMNPERIRAGLVPHTRSERDGHVLDETRSLADGGRRVVKEVVLETPAGEVRRWREDVRLYDGDELERLLAAVGLAVERVTGGFDGAPFGPASERQIVAARRAAAPAAR